MIRSVEICKTSHIQKNVRKIKRVRGNKSIGAKMEEVKNMMHFIHTNYGYCYYELDKPVPEGGTYLVYSLYVHKEYRRNSCAKRMLRYVIDEIRDTGYSGVIYIKAEPQEASIEIERLREFYKSMGLTVT